MDIRENGTRFRNYVAWEAKKGAPYDYERNGLLRHLMSHKIILAAVDSDGEWRPTPLGTILKYVENNLIMIMKYVDRMKNFKNYAYKNR